MIGRAGLVSHIGEFIAERVFSLELEDSRTNKGFDGRFKKGKLKGKTVNVKLYPKRERFIDWKDDALPDYFLILAGPKGKGRRPVMIRNVFVFDSKQTRGVLLSRGVNIPLDKRVQASVRDYQWKEAEIYPNPSNPILRLTPSQRDMLAFFSD